MYYWFNIYLHFDPTVAILSKSTGISQWDKKQSEGFSDTILETSLFPDIISVSLPWITLCLIITLWTHNCMYRHLWPAVTSKNNCVFEEWFVKVTTKWFHEIYRPTAKPNTAKMAMTCHNRSPQKTTVSEVRGSGFGGGSVGKSCWKKKSKYLDTTNKSPQTGFITESKQDLRVIPGDTLNFSEARQSSYWCKIWLQIKINQRWSLESICVIHQIKEEFDVF